MNILFLTLAKLNSINDTMIYADLLHCFSDNGHSVYAVTPLEKKDKTDNYIERIDNIYLLHANIGGDYFNVNTIKKGITLLQLERAYIIGIEQEYYGIKYDLVIYTTPPISFNRVVSYIKKRDGAKTYLLLKDIFPQNAVDIGMLNKHGIKGFIYRYFRHRERELYAVSDRIGCMSPANVEYVLRHNPEVRRGKVHICPNCAKIVDKSVDDRKKNEIRRRYGIPIDKTVFVYGGNLGKPQGVPFIIECLRRCANIYNILFLVIGCGTEYGVIEEYVQKSHQENLRLMDRLPKEDYDNMVGACDVGMIFLDHRFTIPNFPSRLLSYMQAKLPVLACTDPNTDIGKVIVEGGFGWWCESNDADRFVECIQDAVKSDLMYMGDNSFLYLKKNYDVKDTMKTILDHTIY